MIYPCDIYGNPEQFTFLQKLSRKIIEQEDKLLNGCIRVYIIERPSGLPLCSSSRKIKGLMFSKPVHDKISARRFLGYWTLPSSWLTSTRRTCLFPAASTSRYSGWRSPLARTRANTRAASYQHYGWCLLQSQRPPRRPVRFYPIDCIWVPFSLKENVARGLLQQ